MSDPTPSSSQRRPLNEQFHSQGDKLQIRLVPYSPPRLSTDGSIPSRPLSYVDNPPPPAFAVDGKSNVELYARDNSPRTPASSSVSSLTIPAQVRDDGYDGDIQEAHADAVQDDNVNPGEGFAEFKSRRPSLSLSPSLASLSSTTSSPSMSTPSNRRPKRVINVSLHSDKTFSLVPQTGSVSSRADSFSSPHLSSTTSYSSHGQLSSVVFGDDHSSSPLTPLAEHSATPSSIASPSPLASKSSSGSPWNYQLVGGLRKVRSVASDVTQASYSELSQTESLPDPTETTQPQRREADFPLINKQSFQSSKTGSTSSDRTNYKLYNGQSSPAPNPDDDSTLLNLDPEVVSSFRCGNSNYVVHSNSGDHSSDDQSRPPSEQSEPNYIVHNHVSRTPSVATTGSWIRPEFSRESLIVAPLKPTKANGSYHDVASKSRSRDSLRSSSLTSMSSFVNQETTRILLNTAVALPNQVGPAIPHRSLSRQHQWSSALSTVLSESENGSDPASRSASRLSVNGSRVNALVTTRGKRTSSFSSSLMGRDETLATASDSRIVLLDRPQPVYGRETSSSNPRLIRDQDEDGDGLADLEDLHRRPSRVRHHSLLSSYSSDRNLRSAGSSRTNSFTCASIPAWAQLYYGSGERRWLAAKASYESMFSQFSDNQPRNSLLSGSPSYEQFAVEINNPRFRLRDNQQQGGGSGAVEVVPNPIIAVARGIKKQTSSIWSPHLRQDKRASRYSIWAPPPFVQSPEISFWGRNFQLVLFVLGFIIPFAWMIGALLQLPPKPNLDMMERDYSTSHLDLRLESRYQMQDVNEVRLRDRLKWWRRINRRMSILGVFLIGAYITLIVVGSKQQWNSR